MQGVEILASAQVAAENAMNWSTFWIVGIIVWLVVVAIGTCDMVDWYDLIPFGILGLFAGCMFGLFAGGVWFPKILNYETQYQVTISDEVSMTEFYEHYEVIEQDGKIFTVREKVEEE